ncbi:MAG: hypothetical protein HKN64_05430 [Woeseiaceae bacterium]|nr:hypothetical protein [Woeseiaceae bacterium]
MAVLSLAILLSLMPLASAEVTTDEPLVDDVVRMLDAGIESDLVISWLKTGDRRPAALSADALIALSQARASRELIEVLLSMTQNTAPVEEVPASTPQPVAIDPEPVSADKDCCLVDFSVEYRATEDTEGEAFEQPGRDLFLYIDGKYLARLESQGNIVNIGAVRFKSTILPGEHTLRLTRQLHTRKRSKTGTAGWDHETTVSPSIIRFRVEPDAQWQLELRWIQSEFSTRGPLSWRWLRNGTEVASEDKAGEFRERWPFLCEDVAVSGASGAIAGWRMRDRQKGCVDWRSLWPADVQTTRAMVLDDLRRSDYAPPLP